MARLRMQCSNLNHHLCLRFIKDDPKCQCGHDIENSEHFLFHCSEFDNIRNDTLATIDLELDLRTCLYGNPELTDSDNKKICNVVMSYIARSKRFFNGDIEE